MIIKIIITMTHEMACIGVACLWEDNIEDEGEMEST